MRFITEMEGLVTQQLNVIKTGLSLTRMEAKLAVMSIYPLIITICMLMVILMGSWISIMGLIGYGLFRAFNDPLMALSGVLLMNALLLGFLLIYLSYTLKNMSFMKTRAYLSRGQNEPKSTCKENNSQAGQAIGDSTKPA